MAKDKPRVIVIGLDGATWTNLKPWMEQGLLPNLKFLVDNGASGELESTIPRQSAPAWTSFMTGVNPAKHGIFGFVKPFRDKQYKREMVNSSDIKVKTIFEMLSEFNKTSGAINIPITYPSFKINGFMISCGLLTPNTGNNFTYPENLFDLTGLKGSDYILDVNWFDYSKDNKEKFFFDLIECEEKRKEFSFKLMNKYDWDLFVIVFGGTDRIHHYCWHHIDSSHSQNNPEEARKFLPLVIQYYKKLDSIIGEFMNYMDNNSSLFIISDHGFGPREKKFGFHKVLEKESLLYYKKISLISKIKNKISAIITLTRGFLNKNSIIYRKTKEFIKYLVRKIKVKPNKNIKLEPKKIIRSDVDTKYWKRIDWRRTYCYAGYADNTVYLNVKNREPEGILNSNGEYLQVRDKIINLVNNLIDTETGRKLKVKIYKNEEIYNGQYSKNGCDLYLEIENGTYNLRTGAYTKDIFEKSMGWTGSHTRDGIIISYGKNLKKARYIKNASLIDIVPSILYLLGVPISKNLDGVVIKDAIRNDFLDLNPIKYLEKSDKNKPSLRDTNVFDKNDAAQVEKRLADLGYI